MKTVQHIHMKELLVCRGCRLWEVAGGAAIGKVLQPASADVVVSFLADDVPPAAAHQYTDERAHWLLANAYVDCWLSKTCSSLELRVFGDWC